MSTLEAVTAPENLRAAAPRLDARFSVEEIAALDPPAVAELVAEAVEALDEVAAALRADGMAMLEAMPVSSDVTLALTCRYLGELVPAKERPVAYIDHVRPASAPDGPQPHSRRRTALPPHTDQSARANPPDYLALACVANESDAGGESVLVPIEPIARHLRSVDARAHHLLQDAEFPIFNVPRRDFAVTAPLLRLREGRHEIRFRDEAIRAGLREMNRSSEEHVAAFERLSAQIHDERWWLVHRLRPGEMLLFDNKRILHGRTAIHGDSLRDLKRLNGTYRSPQWTR